MRHRSSAAFDCKDEQEELMSAERRSLRWGCPTGEILTLRVPWWARISIFAVAIQLSASVSLSGQWLHYPTPGIPRTPGGKPNLSARVPKTPDGKPDLSGI